DLFPDGMPAAMFDAYVALLGRLADDAAWWSREGDIVLPSAAPVADVHPDADTHIAAGFAAQALRTPDAPVVIDARGPRTYREVAQQAAALRTALEQAGVGVGDTVAVLMPKCAHQLAAVLAIVQAGARTCRSTAASRRCGSRPFCAMHGYARSSACRRSHSTMTVACASISMRCRSIRNGRRAPHATSLPMHWLT
ncbi:non-ribosomal peptide synthase, partial [Pseudomonas aeruginosa]|nr:non-ribosomal peptide synthase [Pseudomonas aeruginosa]